MESVKIFLKLYFRPLAAMSDNIDRGSLIFGLIAAAVLSLAFQQIVNQRLHNTYEPRPAWLDYQDYANLTPEELAALEAQANAENIPTGIPPGKDGTQEMDFLETGAYVTPGLQQLPLAGRKYGRWLFSFTPVGLFSLLIGLAAFYVPGLILLAGWWGHTGSFGVTLRRDYATLLSCVLLAWAAAHWPFVVAAAALQNRPDAPELFLLLWVASTLYFALLVTYALRAVFGLDYRAALTVVALSWLPLALGNQIFKVFSPYLFSPFIIYYLWMYFRGDAGDVGYSYRRKQDFRRHLENATINPHDADAHVQLGLIHLQRRQVTEAFARFTRAIEIDPEEIDARYQLGRLCRERGALAEAINHFGVVVAQNDKYAQNEIWREVGATYLAAGMHADARENLARYVENRPFDPEGLYYYGQTLLALGDQDAARDAFQRCVEAVQTMPYYRRRHVSRWRKLAQSQIA